MADRLRVFISSPGDVRDVREVAAQVVEGVAPDYLRHFHVEPYLWESEALLASGQFQDSIEPPSQFDVVTLILWSRLGTLMPVETPVRRYVGIDGRSPVTGTEWEFEDALQAARSHGVPDILVYRSQKRATVDAWNRERQGEELEQLAALNAFWARHFEDGGTFIAAYSRFQELQEFADLFEGHLRKLITRRIEAGLSSQAGPTSAPAWTKSPFRGLAAFGFEDAPIFFGRSEAVGKALGRLIGNAGAGRSFLLVLGASGSGKSSLARAGVAPRLFLPRRVAGKRFVRRVLFRPGDLGEDKDVFAALARELVTAHGAEVGLPEAGRADRLAEIMRGSPESAHTALEAALDRLTDEGRSRGTILAGEEAALVLIVDQLEELFTDRRIAREQRDGFAGVLRALSAGGRVWVVATMRADLWHRVNECPGLVALADGTGRFDLGPPRRAEIGQMIRLPAQAAGLTFEKSEEDGTGLDDRIAEAAEDAGALPLLSYLLEQLYLTDAVEAGGSTLTLATYEKLGGLEGAVAARAEEVFLRQPEDVQAALPALVFALVQVNADDAGGRTLTARRAPLGLFAEGDPARALIDAFLDPQVRLVVADRDAGGAAMVRFAHEALLRQWTRARDYIEQDAILLTIRRRIEDRFDHWRSLRPGQPDLRGVLLQEAPGLLSGIDLEDARRLARERRAALPAELAQYIEKSARQDRRRRRRLLVALGAAATIMAVLALVAGGMAIIAHDEATTAEIQLAARQIVDIENDGDTAMKAHNVASAIALYKANIGRAQKLIALDPSDPQARLDLALLQARLGYALQRSAASSDRAQAQPEFVQAQQTAKEVATMDASLPAVRQERLELQNKLQDSLESASAGQAGR